MSDEGLKVGDVVSLRIGGPIMTVSKEFDDVVETVWFSDRELFRDMFPMASLMKWQPA